MTMIFSNAGQAMRDVGKLRTSGVVDGPMRFNQVLLTWSAEKTNENLTSVSFSSWQGLVVQGAALITLRTPLPGLSEEENESLLQVSEAAPVFRAHTAAPLRES